VKLEMAGRSLLLVGCGLSGGGAEKHLARLARSLQDFRVEIAVLKNSGLAGSRRKLHHLGWSGDLSYPRVVLRLVRVLRFGVFDVVLAQGFYPGLLSTLAAGSMSRTPLVIYFEVTRPLAALEYERNPLRRIFVRWAYRTFISRAGVILANSLDGLNEAAALIGRSDRRYRLVGNFVEWQDLQSRRLPLDERMRSPIIVWVGRISPEKRLQDLLRAACLLASEPQWRLWVVGDGPDRARAQRLALELGIGDRVTFWGWLAHPAEVVRQAAVYVHSSRIEGFPNSLIEAAALGVPIVTSFWGTDARRLCAGGAALGHEPGDVGTLAANIRTILRSPALGSELVQAAERECIVHDVRVCAEQLAAIMGSCAS
jgi:glycosyltransferase involved in cell wall biosynthesis